MGEGPEMDLKDGGRTGDGSPFIKLHQLLDKSEVFAFSMHSADAIQFHPSMEKGKVSLADMEHV